jgi:hypothetical protein
MSQFFIQKKLEYKINLYPECNSTLLINNYIIKISTTFKNVFYIKKDLCICGIIKGFILFKELLEI